MNYDTWKSTEPDNRDDDPPPDGDECQWCHAKAGDPCAKDCRPPGADVTARPECDLECGEWFSNGSPVCRHGRTPDQCIASLHRQAGVMLSAALMDAGGR